jgi:tricorn protease
LLLQDPSLSRTQIVFNFAGNLWIVGRQGGDARRLTTGGHEWGPHFSPDGAWVAFTAEYDGNQDVYLVPASGGVPRRLTYHPGPDLAAGWTPDGQRVLFGSWRSSFTWSAPRLFTIAINGSFPTEVPLPRAVAGSFSPDGARLAYVPIQQWQPAWKRYRGGQTLPVWIANLSDSSVEAKIPRDNSNDFNPMWVGDTIYFLSDRNGPVTLFAYDSKSKQVKEVVHNDGLDIKSASAGPGGIVYEQFGSLHVLDLTSGQDQRLEVRVLGDVPEVRPHFQKIEPKRIQSAALSPTGARAVFAARGEILTVPAEKGDIRNLTRTPDAVERDPAWSPDGKSIAYLSDESGEYALHIRDQSGLGEVRKIALANSPTFYYSPRWSPDGKKIAYTNKRLQVWYVDLNKKKPVRVDTDTYAGPFQLLNPVWSPDSRWLAYTKQLRNHLHAIFIHSLEQGQNHRSPTG